MELQSLSFSIIYPFLLFAAMVFLMLKKSSTRNLPPGPWKLPIIGNIHNVLGNSLPHHRLQALAKKYGPIMHLQLGEFNTMIVSSPEIAKEVLQTHDLIFANRSFNMAASIIFYNASDIAFAPYGESWRKLRKICMLELFSTKRVQSFRPIREEEILKVMKSISETKGDSRINLSKILFSYTYQVIARAAFGETRKGREEFLPLVKDITEVTAGFCIANLFPSLKFLHNIGGMKDRMERLHQESDRIFETIITDHKFKREALRNSQIGDKDDDQESDHDDLIDVLLNFHELENVDFALTIESVKGVILDLFVAGSDTSFTVVEWAMSEMIKSPEVLKKAQLEVRQVFREKGYVDEAGLKDLNYLKLVIKETLRLHPPIPLILPRESQAECEINGYYIPTKSKVIINAWAIGRDPRYWKNADRFIPERFSDGKVDYKGTHFEFIPFGAGRRMCPGMIFGMANTELPLANLLFYFDWKLPGEMKPEDLDMLEDVGASVRRKNCLELVPVVCHPVPDID